MGKELFQVKVFFSSHYVTINKIFVYNPVFYRRQMEEKSLPKIYLSRLEFFFSKNAPNRLKDIKCLLTRNNCGLKYF